MTAHPIFSKQVWKEHFIHITGIHELPLSSLVAADEMLDAVRQAGPPAPNASDYAMWAQDLSPDDPGDWLNRLSVAATVILSSELPKIAAAQALLETEPPVQKTAVRVQQSTPEEPWDPCQKGDGTLWPRKVSVRPWDLPADWQTELRRAARGLPGKMAAAPARDILQRMCEKLCQLSWSAQKTGLLPNLTERVVGQYLEDLEARLRARPNGIRWATLRATVEELYRFARYIGTLPDDDLQYLMKRLTRYEFFERGQDALKFTALLETGNTTLSVLNRADALLKHATKETDPKTRHRLRNAGAILGLYSIVPLRNADAELIFSETLIWESGTWVVDTPIQKTAAHSPEHLVIPLEPEFCRYVDAVVLGDFDHRHLPDLRERAIKTRRPLILHPNLSRPAKNHIARVFKKHTGNSFTTARTMLHTDQAISRGEAGTTDSMVMCHQKSLKTARKYQEQTTRRAAIKRVQNAVAIRRSSQISPDLLNTLKTFDDNEEADS